jgi:hypothetical protein
VPGLRTTGVLDSVNRRTALAMGGASAFSLAFMPSMTAVAGDTSVAPTAKSIIFLALYGGPPHQDTYDLKPNAPASMRGEFNPISTTVPGIQFCEYLPKLSKLAHLVTILRSVTHTDNGHESAFYALMTGRPHPQPNTVARPEPRDHPAYGSMINYLKTPTASVPGYVLAGGRTSTGIGQTGGFLGAGWAPYLIRQDANEPGFRVDDLTLPQHISKRRFVDRRDLLERLNAMSRGGDLSDQAFSTHHEQVFDMLTTASMRNAFAIEDESSLTRAAYGDHPFGQNLLLARRLVEAGVPIVQVNWRNRGDGGFDTHSNNFNMCKGYLLPKLDGCLSALLIDLEERGLLDQTLVVAAGEFGRTPRINRDGGRDHWAGVNSMLLAGGGIKRGYVFGSSDRIGAYPASNPVGPWDVYATMLHCCGIDPAMHVKDSLDRPIPICSGNVIPDVLV